MCPIVVANLLLIQRSISSPIVGVAFEPFHYDFRFFSIDYTMLHGVVVGVSI